MTRCLFLAVLCALSCLWVPTSEAVPPLPPCAWRLDPAQDTLVAYSGAPIWVEVAQSNEPCSRDGMVLLDVEVLDQDEEMWPASVNVAQGNEGFWITPQRALAPDIYQVRLSYNGLTPNEGWVDEAKEFELTVLPGQVTVELSKFEPKTERRYTQECCADGYCEEMCRVGSSSSLMEMRITYLEGVRALEIRVEYASSRRVEDLSTQVPEPQSLDLFLVGDELAEVVEREVFVSLDDYVEPCARLFALDPDTKSILHTSAWGCVGPLTVEEPCVSSELVCAVSPEEQEDLGARRPNGDQGPGMVTARPSGGCGGCATAPGGGGSSSVLALWGLLLLGRRRRKNAPLRRADA